VELGEAVSFHAFYQLPSVRGACICSVRTRADRFCVPLQDVSSLSCTLEFELLCHAVNPKKCALQPVHPPYACTACTNCIDDHCHYAGASVVAHICIHPDDGNATRGEGLHGDQSKLSKALLPRQTCPLHTLMLEYWCSTLSQYIGMGKFVPMLVLLQDHVVRPCVGRHLAMGPTRNQPPREACWAGHGARLLSRGTHRLLRVDDQPPELKLKAVAKQRFRVGGVAEGTHEYLAVTFDEEHFALCNATVHTILHGYTTTDIIEG
jgi:hypothetical protein